MLNVLEIARPKAFNATVYQIILVAFAKS
jgi:hypothetical protein